MLEHPDRQAFPLCPVTFEATCPPQPCRRPKEQYGFSGVSGFGVVLFKRTIDDSYAGVHESAHLRDEPSESYIKEGRGSGSDLAVTNHDVRNPFIAPPPGLCFATPRSLSTPTQADYSHFKSLSRTMFFKADEMPFSTDYMEWGLRRSELDCEGPLELAMIVDESDEAQPRHRGGHGHQDPGHRHFLL